MSRVPKSVKIIDYKKSKINEEEFNLRENAEPDYLCKDFNCPDFLDDEAKMRWEEIKHIFLQMRNCPITDADSSVMSIHCQAWSDYLKYDKEIKNNPEPLLVKVAGKKNNGEVRTQIIKNPYYELRHKSALLVKTTTSDLCLDVVSRAKVGTARMSAKKDDESNLMKLLIERKGDNS